MTQANRTSDLVAWLRERCWSMHQPPRPGATIIVDRDRLIECADELERLTLEFQVSSQQAAQLRDQNKRLKERIARLHELVRT